MAEHVILFAGPMGAGKTTAIRSLSDIEVVERGGVVIGVTRSDLQGHGGIAQAQAAADAVFPNRPTPVFQVDARDSGQMRVMLMTLIADVETREMMKGVR
ncbi:MAG: hypothetical protein J0H64_10310 [Actinobacteria bacterium]|nr:hypothetical protein [Actinomycetota bacterium]